MSKAKVFLILSVSLFASLTALLFFSYGEGDASAPAYTAFGKISENQLIAGLAAAAIGSLLTALVVFIIEDNRDKRQAAVAILEEFTSYDFLETRNRAGLVFKSHLHFPTKGLDDLYHVLRNDNWRYVSHIEHFYKKVDRLLALGEVDETYVKSFLEGEFPHWYNRYFFPARVADLARWHEGAASEKGMAPSMLLRLDAVQDGKVTVGARTLEIPLPEVDFVSAYGAVRTPEEKAQIKGELVALINHAEALVAKGVLKPGDFKRTAAWADPGDGAANFIAMYDGDQLPFPKLRALTKA
ncbi:hypothetical protein [Tropicibacter naphthalenivorans]|uniref:Uncharacterized protein n=1 Tax=Tropicibacter naphthalenivorans TaxID=441103 RepID=A0A0P1GN48_9RHOB|nr:hypothetical protein [Tropicibacter naphthalenivorans]CUH76752.1 hypothetical protein TRN7648_01110 [Tropicibacter naphthalenivorans]SMC63234.1 hypothetical protein SAMN04488093_102508 [Tropicibacter naphthalenivorans]